MNVVRLYCRWYPRATRSAASTTDVNSARWADETPDSVTPEDPGGRKYPRRPPANKNVGILPTWPTPIGPSCQNSNALTPPRPEPVWFSLVHSSPSRLAPLTASTRTKFKFPFVDLWSFFQNFLSQISRLAASQSTFLSACDELKWQKIPAGHRWLELGYGFGWGDHCTIFSVAFSAGRWSSRCLEAYVRFLCFFCEWQKLKSEWSAQKGHVIHCVTGLGCLCKWMLWSKLVSTCRSSRLGFRGDCSTAVYSQRSRTAFYVMMMMTFVHELSNACEACRLIHH